VRENVPLSAGDVEVIAEVTPCTAQGGTEVNRSRTAWIDGRLGYPDSDEISDAGQEKICSLDAQTRGPELRLCSIDDGLARSSGGSTGRPAASGMIRRANSMKR
jgi:hypothetical protein